MNRMKYQRGQAMIVATLFFLAVSMTIIFGLSKPILNQEKIVSNLFLARQSYFLAESGLEDVVYRLKNGLPVSSTQDVTLSGFSATTDTTDSGESKIVTATSDWNGIIRTIEAKLTQGQGVAFNYGLQAGNGGATIDGGSTIIGNIYSNGSINAISATITGTAVAADSAALTADQSNDSPATPTDSISFRNTSGSQDFAQSFEISSGSPLNKVQFYIKKVGSPANATVRLVADNNGSPSTTQIPIGSASLVASQVTTSFGWVEVVFPNQVSLIADTPYWIVIDNSSQSSSNYYAVAANSNYASGLAKTGSYGGSWTSSGLDGYFKIFTGGISSYIGGASYPSGLIVGTDGVGDAWATTVKGTSAQGKIYCTTGTNNNKACDTTHGSAPSASMPISQSNIDAWKAEAEAGGVITGNHTVGSAGETIGPKKITGNLTVNGGGTLTLSGTLWVEGTITVTGGGKIKLPASFAENSGAIISDSYVTVSGGGSAGSGTTGSYIFFVSTSKCPNDVNCSGNSAININGGAGAIAAFAQNGNVALSGGASINSAVGNSISLTGGSTVTYETGLASPSFTSGPSGGYQIFSWKEIQ